MNYDSENLVAEIKELSLENKSWVLDGHTDNGQNDDVCSNIDQVIETNHRIGSQSNAAEVYKVTNAGQSFACKIMPIINAGHEKENLQEIKHALAASKIVVDGKSAHFPMVYASGMCPNVRFDKSSNFLVPSQFYQLQKMIHTQYGRHKALRYRQLFANRNIDDMLQGAEDLGVNASQIETSAHFLISELAWGDLSSYLAKNKNQLSKQSLKSLYTQILMVIQDMQTHLNMIHDDFHTGNILVVSGSPIRLLAHDFGKSRRLEEKPMGRDSLVDIETVTAKLVDNFSLADLEPMMKFISEKAKCIDDVIGKWADYVGVPSEYVSLLSDNIGFIQSDENDLNSFNQRI